MRTCAVIPAAGRGTRLGSDTPKIFTPLGNSRTVWSVLHGKISPLVDHVHVVLSPEGVAAAPVWPTDVSTSVQPAPLGMGDAIFRGQDIWSQYNAVLIVWGDQVFVSADTLKRTLTALKTPRQLVLPVTRMAKPYVEYVFDGTRLAAVRQSREGDSCTPNGFSDVGTFALTTDGLQAAWDIFQSSAGRGEQSGEINFLPFLPFLSAQGWDISSVEVADATEARGINTKDDLAFFQSLYKNNP